MRRSNFIAEHVRNARETWSQVGCGHESSLTELAELGIQQSSGLRDHQRTAVAIDQWARICGCSTRRPDNRSKGRRGPSGLIRTIQIELLADSYISARTVALD